jgi:hypothetical protein
MTRRYAVRVNWTSRVDPRVEASHESSFKSGVVPYRYRVNGSRVHSHIYGKVRCYDVTLGRLEQTVPPEVLRILATNLRGREFSYSFTFDAQLRQLLGEGATNQHAAAIHRATAAPLAARDFVQSAILIVIAFGLWAWAYIQPIGSTINDVPKGTALTAAAARGAGRKVAALLARGAPVNGTDTRGWTALFCAAENGHATICKMLLDAGADPNIRSRQRGTALMVAAAQGHSEIVRLLLGNGADASAQDSIGKSALDLAGSMVDRTLSRCYALKARNTFSRLPKA